MTFLLSRARKAKAWADDTLFPDTPLARKCAALAIGIIAVMIHVLVKVHTS